MLETLSEDEKVSFKVSLKAAIEERDEIQLLLDEIRTVMEDAKNPR
jgi:hypothetical protein